MKDASPKRQLSESELRAALGECVMRSSWFYCVAGVILAIPLSVKLKTYSPVVYLGLGGTAVDLINGISLAQLPPLLHHSPDRSSSSTSFVPCNGQAMITVLRSGKLCKHSRVQLKKPHRQVRSRKAKCKNYSARHAMPSERP
jgi:hypothetical protein